MKCFFYHETRKVRTPAPAREESSCFPRRVVKKLIHYGPFENDNDRFLWNLISHGTARHYIIKIYVIFKWLLKDWCVLLSFKTVSFFLKFQVNQLSYNHNKDIENERFDTEIHNSNFSDSSDSVRKGAGMTARVHHIRVKNVRRIHISEIMFVKIWTETDLTVSIFYLRRMYEEIWSYHHTYVY